LINILCYNKTSEHVCSIEITEIEAALNTPDNLLWIDIEYFPDVWPSQNIIDLLQNTLKIHPLNVEDCITSRQNPKYEEYEEYSFSITAALQTISQDKITFGEIDIVLGKNFVMTYRHGEIEEVAVVKNAFMTKINHMHKSSTMLFHTIIDAVVDGYRSIIDNFDVYIDKVADDIYKNPDDRDTTYRLNKVKETISEARSVIVAEEAIFLNASKGFYSIIEDSENIFFKDIYDHLNKVLEKLDRQSGTISNLFVAQMNLSSQKLNELIKFLTIISALLLPANLITGIFGMNFKYMPPLEVHFGFPISLISIFSICIIMVIFFKLKKWM